MGDQTRELPEATKGTVGAAVGLNLQASLGFTLIGTDFYALFQKKGDKNTFLVMPTLGEPSKGMTIDEMVAEVNKLFKRATGQDAGLDSQSIKASITDVVNASEDTPQENALTVGDIDWKNIRVYLDQAFLYLNTGEAAEYAFAIRIDTSQLFGGSSFFNVSGLSLGIWNTDREKVLERMKLEDVDSALKELE